MNNAIAIIGSSRRDGNTGKLIDLIARESKIDVIDLNTKYITPFDYEHKNINDDFLPTMSHILKYDHIIFASPVYWYSMSAQMKTFIDRMSDFLSIEELKDTGRELRNKTGHVASTSISEKVDDSFIDSFTNTFDYLGMSVGHSIHVNCINGFNHDSCQTDIHNFIKKLNMEKSAGSDSS